jgi:hypothetical protein
MRKVTAGIIAVSVLLSLFGCAVGTSEIITDAVADPYVVVDRSEFIDEQIDSGAKNIGAIVGFIQEYNDVQVRDLRLGDYSVEKVDDEDETYSVTGNGYTMLLRLDDYGNVVFGSCNSSTGAVNKAVSGAILDALWPMDLTPVEFREKMALLQLENWVGSDELLENIQRFNGADLAEIEIADSNLPDPSVTLDVGDLKDPEMYKSEDLKEPKTEKPFDGNVKPDQLPSIGGFGQPPEYLDEDE